MGIRKINWNFKWNSKDLDDTEIYKLTIANDDQIQGLVAIKDNKIVDVDFYGGCSGNLQGIKKLIIGMDIDDVIERVQGIKCGPKPTSCPDQLAKCLIEYKKQAGVKAE